MAIDISAGFLRRRPADFRSMIPIQFLRRDAGVFPDRVAGIYEDITRTWQGREVRAPRPPQRMIADS